MYTCTECGGEMVAAKVTLEIHEEKIVVHGYRCVSCGEEILTDDVVTTSVESSVQTIPNPVINQEVQLNPSDMIQNPELTSQEQVVEEKQVESLSQPAVQVIDFGSTSSVDIEH